MFESLLYWVFETKWARDRRFHLLIGRAFNVLDRDGKKHCLYIEDDGKVWIDHYVFIATLPTSANSA